MKRYLALILVVVLAFSLTGCMNVETVPEEKNLEVLNNDGKSQYISKYFETVDGVITFIKQTGLEEIFLNILLFKEKCVIVILYLPL